MTTIRTTRGGIPPGLFEELEQCPYCGSSRLVISHERGEITCDSCGAVMKTRIIDEGPEWRSFTSEEKDKRSRVGSPVYPRLSSMASVSATIDWTGKDAAGKKLSSEQRMKVIRLRRWHKVSINVATERNLLQAEDEIDRLVSQMGIPQTVKNEALMIYRKAISLGLVKGRSIGAVVAAALYAACRKMKIPITLDEFAIHIGKDKQNKRKEIARCYRLLVRDVGIKVSVADPLDYVDRIMNILKLRPEIQLTAMKLIKEAKEKGLTAGKDPAGFAAAAVYIATLIHGEKRTQKEVAKAASVTEVTIRNRYKEFIRSLNIPNLP